MANNKLEFALLNPLKMMWVSERFFAVGTTDILQTFHPSFQNKHIDSDFYVRTLKDFEYKQGYSRPYQRSDTIVMQWLSSDATAGHHYCQLLNSNGSVYFPKVIAVTQESGSWGTYGLKLYTVNIPLYDIIEGNYFLRIFTGSGGVYYNAISEPFYIKQYHPNTIRIDYRNSFNDQSIIYPSSTYTMQIRVHGCIQRITTMSKTNGYEDQPMNYVVVSGVKYRLYNLIFGIDGAGMPDYEAEKLTAVMVCDTVKYDGIALSKPDDQELKKESQDSPMSQYTISLRERYNTEAIEIRPTAKVLGTMPQTKYFWVEQISLGSASNIRQGFRGKANFLDYLNSAGYSISQYGFFAENDRGELVIQTYDDYTFVGTWTLSAADVLLYGIKFTIDGTGIFKIKISAPAAGHYYAVEYGNGFNDNKTGLAITPSTTTISNTYNSTTPGIKEVFIYMSNCYSVTPDATNTMAIVSIGGDFAPALNSFSAFSPATRMERFEDNVFKYVTALNSFSINGEAFNTHSVNELIMNMWDYRTHLAGTATIDLSGQQYGGAPPTLSDPGIAKYTNEITALITTLNYD